jgi:hypothetical protein
MINIDKSSMFGKGHHRECYIHPENQNLCIKITVDNNLSARQEQREKKYYRHLEKRSISWDMIPRYHGDIITNRGVGSVFDLISDQAGGVSKTLSYYISSNEVTEENYSSLENSLCLLKGYLLEQRIITSMGHRNIVCQRDKSEISRLFVVDNIGNPDYIPICNYNNFLAKKKIYRRWKNFEDSMFNDYPHNKALQRMLTSSHR